MHPGLLSSYRTAEYLLVIQPHEALCDEIIGLKKYFAEKYDCPSAATGMPGITLARFQQFEMIEHKLLYRLQLVAASNDSFMVELHDFGSFPTHTVTINVSTQTQLVELVRSLRPMQQLMKIDKERKPHFITQPYITLARKLLPWQYEKGWLELSHTHFSGRFIADHLLLLRRRQGEKWYAPLKRFGLLNKKDCVDQGRLFE